jgi:hypothetical protein
MLEPLLEHPLCRRGGDVQKQKSTLRRLKTRDKTRLYTNTFLYFTLFNKLLVLPNTTINFGPSTQENIGPFEPDRHQRREKSSTRANSATTVKIPTIIQHPSQQRDDGEKLPAHNRSHPQSQASTTTG